MATQNTQPLTVGTIVRLPMGRGQITARIIEDRGLLGIEGRRLYRVETLMDPEESSTFEVSEESVTPVDLTAERAELDSTEIIDYLQRGGLVAMLRSNQAGGRNPSRVWLFRDSLGNVSHTFLDECGVAGGQVPPAMALHNHEHIFLPKRDEVLGFLHSFGLSDDQAEQVLQKVGTSS